MLSVHAYNYAFCLRIAIRQPMRAPWCKHTGLIAYMHEMGAYWGISRGYLLPHFFYLLPKSAVFSYLLPEAICCRLPNDPFTWEFEIYRINFPPNLIVACCGRDSSNCCMLRPKMWQLLRVAAKFLFVARCRIPQYVPNERPTKGYVNMHEQVAKSLVYSLAGGSTCMSVCLLGMKTCALELAGGIQFREFQHIVTRSIVEMKLGPKFSDLHSFPKERQFQKSCVSFWEECRRGRGP